PGDRLHVDRERADPRRHRRQGHAAGGGDQRGVFHPGRTDRDRHLPVPHPRALRDRRHPPAARAPRRAAVNPGTLVLATLLVLPAAGAMVLALISDDRKGAWLNAFVSFLTLSARCSCSS